MLNYIFPIILIVGSNLLYHIVAKSTPSNANSFASLIITYLTAAFATAVLLFFNWSNKDITQAFKGINWTSVVLGIAIVGLEFGYITAYRVGWNISVGSLVANISLAVLLIIVGVLIYKEHISVNQIIGMVLCVLGLIFINKK